MSNIAHMSARLKELINKKSALNKSEKDEISELIFKLNQDLKDNMSYIVDTLQEKMDDIVSKSKTEVEAAIQSTMIRAGMKSMISTDNYAESTKIIE